MKPPKEMSSYFFGVETLFLHNYWWCRKVSDKRWIVAHILKNIANEENQ